MNGAYSSPTAAVALSWGFRLPMRQPRREHGHNKKYLYKQSAAVPFVSSHIRFPEALN